MRRNALVGIEQLKRQLDPRRQIIREELRETLERERQKKENSGKDKTREKRRRLKG